MKKNISYPKSRAAKNRVKEPTINIFPLTPRKPLREHIEEMSGKNVRNRSSQLDVEPFLAELGIEIEENRQPIQFTSNHTEPIHRWSPYIQGFSAQFVQSIITKYKREYELGKPLSMILDPFSGTGTVLKFHLEENYCG